MLAKCVPVYLCDWKIRKEIEIVCIDLICIGRNTRIISYDRIQEFLFDSARSRICCRCCNCAGDGTCALLLREFKCGGGGKDWRRRLRKAGLRLYFSFACNNNSLKTWDIFKLSLADTWTKPFSHLAVTNSLVLSLSTCKRRTNRRSYYSFFLRNP